MSTGHRQADKSRVVQEEAPLARLEVLVIALQVLTSRHTNPRPCMAVRGGVCLTSALVLLFHAGDGHLRRERGGVRGLDRG